MGSGVAVLLIPNRYNFDHYYYRCDEQCQRLGVNPIQMLNFGRLSRFGAEFVTFLQQPLAFCDLRIVAFPIVLA